MPAGATCTSASSRSTCRSSWRERDALHSHQRQHVLCRASSRRRASSTSRVHEVRSSASRSGDCPQFWAEAATRITLPNSGLRIGYATGYHDWQSGCSMSQILICHPPNQWLGVAAGNLTPTRQVAWSFADFMEGKRHGNRDDHPSVGRQTPLDPTERAGRSEPRSRNIKHLLVNRPSVRAIGNRR